MRDIAAFFLAYEIALNSVNHSMFIVVSISDLKPLFFVSAPETAFYSSAGMLI